MAPHSPRQSIAQPAVGPGQNLDAAGFQSHFLEELPVQGIFHRFTRIDPALGKLPGIPASNAPRPENLAQIVGKNDSDVGPETVGVYHENLSS